MLSSMFDARRMVVIDMISVIEMITVSVMPPLECALRLGGGDRGRSVLAIDTKGGGRIDAAHLPARRGCRQRVRASGWIRFFLMAELPRLDPRHGLRRSLMPRVGVGSSRLHLPAVRCVRVGRRRLRVSGVVIRRRGLRVLGMAGVVIRRRGLRVLGMAGLRAAGSCCSVRRMVRTSSRVSPVHGMTVSGMIHPRVVHRGMVHS
jgi:hypothetical protein